MKIRQTAFRLTERDLQILDECKEVLGVPTRVEALRHAIRGFIQELKRRESPRSTR